MIEVQRATPGDFLEIAALDRTAWKGNRNNAFIPDGEHVWRLWAEHALTFTARSAGRLLGAIVAFPCLDGRFCVHKVMVEPAERGQGVGSRLFERLLKELDARAEDAFLTVDPENKAALALYAKWGFDERSFVPGFYRAEEDRYVLLRRARF
ncbi:GNAT family N-acetyltransferase [Paucidesulfovibrio longus]|uniref:GNAT family N-acetyltransferase n=1 Tax=Paucidesulfovibrio longus TaxID=889 RepID=UPI0003B65F4A|nr:GNAT family N-acetyltransferase [Paucidesulfovibrio longus]